MIIDGCNIIYVLSHNYEQYHNRKVPYLAVALMGNGILTLSKFGKFIRKANF